MTRKQIEEWMNNPELLNEESLIQLEFLVHRFPLFTSARYLYLKNLRIINSPRFQEELNRASAYVPNHSVLYYYIEKGILPITREEQSIEIKKKEITSPTEAYPQSVKETETRSSASILAKQALATQDYATYFLSDLPEINTDPIVPDKKKSRKDSLLDSYLEQSKNDRMFKPIEFKQAEDEEVASAHSLPFQTDISDSFFTESLAKIYIKQKKYDKALNIIKRLSLKYPEKNRYFADQIRYLEIIVNNINI